MYLRQNLFDNWNVPFNNYSVIHKIVKFLALEVIAYDKNSDVNIDDDNDEVIDDVDDDEDDLESENGRGGKSPQYAFEVS